MYLPPGDDTRWFLIEKRGKVLMFNNDDGIAAVSITADFGTMVDDTGEGGLLGMAFHPSFSGSGQVYFNYTVTGPGPEAPLTTNIVRYNLNISGIIDTGSRSLVLSVDQPATNHNGGDIKFGPDENLYITLGDGGGGR